MPLVSIIIPNHNQRKYLEPCITSILEKSTYTNYEILIVENHSTESDIFEYYKELEQYSNIKILRYTAEFNYASVNNFAVKEAKGDYLLLLNNDTEIITPSWIEEMLMYAQRDDVGEVGVKLYYSNETIQHAGMNFRFSSNNHPFLPIFYHLPRNSFGYANRLSIVENIPIVTGACIMSSRNKYLEVGGLDERFKIECNDCDYSMKLRAKNYLVIFNPFCELYHYESVSRGYNDTKEKIELHNKEHNLFLSKWSNYKDIYYNPNFNAYDYDYSIKNSRIERIYYTSQLRDNKIQEQPKKLKKQKILIKQLRNAKLYKIKRLILATISILLKVYRLIRDYNLIKRSGVFDAEYYLAKNQDVKRAQLNPIMHYLRFGWKEGRNPSEQFNTKAYLKQKPDVTVAQICPLVHYLKFRKYE